MAVHSSSTKQQYKAAVQSSKQYKAVQSSSMQSIAHLEMLLDKLQDEKVDMMAPLNICLHQRVTGILKLLADGGSHDVECHLVVDGRRI
jgi:hypothetical protein